MAEKRKGDAVAVSVMLSAGATCIVWTCLTGALWPWLPVIGGSAVSLAVIRAVKDRRQ